MIEARINARLSELQSEARTLEEARNLAGGGMNTDRAACAGWIASAMHVLSLIISDPISPYRAAALRLSIKAQSASAWEPAETAVKEFAGILRALQRDIAAGLITRIDNAVRGETYDDLLDHAQDYLKGKRKEGSGTLAGVVFEDTMRRIAKTHSVTETGMDQLITALEKKGVLNTVLTKRCRAAAALRTSATHARWEEFELPEVQATINVTRELINQHLAGTA